MKIKNTNFSCPRNSRPIFNSRTPRNANMQPRSQIQTRVQIQMNRDSSKRHISTLMGWGCWGWSRRSAAAALVEHVIEQVLACIDDAVTSVHNVADGISGLRHVLKGIGNGAEPRRVTRFNGSSEGLGSWDGCSIDYGSQCRSGKAEGGNEGGDLGGETHFEYGCVE